MKVVTGYPGFERRAEKMAELIKTLTTGGLVTLIRLSSGMTVEELAAKLKVSWGSMMQLESNKAQALDSLRGQLEAMLASSSNQGEGNSNITK